jgi:hypothetical protein
VLKKLAMGGTKNIMATIASKYGFLLTALHDRDPDHPDKAPEVVINSSLAGLASRGPAEDRTKAVAMHLGKHKDRRLNAVDMAQVVDLWAIEDKELDSLCDRWRSSRTHAKRHKRDLAGLADWREYAPGYTSRRALTQHQLTLQKMTSRVKDYERLVYGGFVFRTHASQSGLNALTTDNANVACDYYEADNNQQLTRVYGKITRIFEHACWPGGPVRLVLQCEWFENVGTNEVARTPMVRRNPNSGFNVATKFTFINSCCTKPVAIWPHVLSDPGGDVFDVIDKNLLHEEGGAL